MNPPASPVQPRLACRNLVLGYGSKTVCREVTLTFPDGAFTAILGPNGCGKSTLLKALGGSLTPTSGQISLNGRPLGEYSAREAARSVSLLPQNPVVPEQITVRELVARGRYPHHSLFRRSSPGDRRAVGRALQATSTESISNTVVSELSGGQRQRVWLALALAQDTDVILLDEPTTFLDIAHQYDMLELFAQLRDEGRTLIAVMHDLGQAARYADHLVMMRDGHVRAVGAPADVLTEESVSDTFGLKARILFDPVTGTPLVVR
ncbi:ABC transporter ATP-binding protein [Aestuariimicrobium sp. p3-SID1156]|uniref:ABC transporter ATP-binding protein n=1 Tax=Aestuariimicrobium sp. p3-SID1156 TaxID=2916038 RepID=UPI00223B5BD1|nr:ABC transporter ATP-binding protein [Aestuariimicrobium sp. p3-SID1156]MCT1459235.1 ABC transporter ATP-binding protein [Aestuariimicrobium sp. p3-SID1156]